MGKFVIRQTKTGIKFDPKASNGEVIATSGVYAAEDSCRKGIARTNGQIIAVSEGYKALASCLNGIESVKKNAPDARIEKE